MAVDVHVAGKIRSQVEIVFTLVKLLILVLPKLNKLSLEKNQSQIRISFGFYTWISINLLSN